jgi:hypothetical protein
VKRKATSDIDVAAIHADLRGRYGDTVTRMELFAYRDETGVYPVWIRRDASLRVGRGRYRIPGDAPTATVKIRAGVVPASTPVRESHPKSAAKTAKLGREVLAGMSDDYDDEGPVDVETVEPTDHVAKRGRRGGRKPADGFIVPTGEQKWDYKHAYVCTVSHKHPRKDETARLDAVDGVKCDACGGKMSLHFFSKRLA